jgi:hypothetical protein
MVRPAMTAIAAVIALSTPSFAQSGGEPIVVTSAPAIEVTQAPVVADPIAPEAAQPAPGKSATAKSTAASLPPVAAHSAGAEPMISAPGATISDPDAAASVEPLPNQPEVAPVQAPVAEPSALADTNTTGSMIPIVGVGVLGILALTGAGLVMRRRRRRSDDADDAARRQLAGTAADADPTKIDEPEPAMIVAHEPPASPEPTTQAIAAETAAVAAAVVAAHEPSPEIDGPVTELPEDFDTSQFGLHAQAAYNGPTEDNPSLSLKHRLSRANGMDQLAEREAEAEVAAAPDEVQAAMPVVAPSAKGDFVPGLAGTKPSRPKPIVRPAHCH